MQAIRSPVSSAATLDRFLLVVTDDDTASHPLPAHGELVIGRGPSCHIIIDNPAISPIHAILHLSPDQIAIEDLGTPTGTWVRDRRIPPRHPIPVHRGETVELGSSLLLIKRRPFAARLVTHSAFEKALDQVAATAARSGAMFALMRIHCDPSHSAAVIEAALRALVPEAHHTGYYAPGHYEALLLDLALEQVRARAAQVEAALQDRGIRARVDITDRPRDARYTDAAAEAVARAPVGHADVAQDPGAVIGGTSAMDAIRRLARRIAPSEISVLILGETGVGKDVVAEMIHQMSARADQPLVRLNCAALSETLLASELFGHERGAFTGAFAAKPGLLETGEGGSVFLDEVGELPLLLQAKLLHVLEERQVTRVGGLHPRSIDVRFIAATNRDLEAEVEAGTFRRDLYYRLNAACVTIPPLRERVDEILPLAQGFLDEAAPRMQLAPAQLAPDAGARLQRHPWPGNIRELKNVVMRALLMCKDGVILPEHLGLPEPGARGPGKLRVIPASTASMAPLFAGAGSPGPGVPGRAEAGGGLPHDASGATTPGAGGAHAGPAGAAPSIPSGPPGPFGPPRPFGPPGSPGSFAASDGAARDAAGQVPHTDRQRILETLTACGGNQTQAAQRLGISRRTLINRMLEYDLPRPRRGTRNPDRA